MYKEVREFFVCVIFYPYIKIIKSTFEKATCKEMRAECVQHYYHYQPVFRHQINSFDSLRCKIQPRPLLIDATSGFVQ